MKLQQIVTNRFDYVIRYNWAGCGENCWVLVHKVKVHGNVCFQPYYWWTLVWGQETRGLAKGFVDFESGWIQCIIYLKCFSKLECE